MKKMYQLETVTCPSCVVRIEGMLSKTKGIEQSDVRFNTSRVSVVFDDEIISSQEIIAKIQQLGYQVLSEK
jgi:copper chaperone